MNRSARIALSILYTAFKVALLVLTAIFFLFFYL